MNRILILAGLLLVLTPSCSNKKQPAANQKNTLAMKITKRSFGSLHGEEVHLFTLANDAGFTVEITNYGGIVTSIITPDKRAISMM